MCDNNHEAPDLWLPDNSPEDRGLDESTDPVRPFPTKGFTRRDLFRMGGAVGVVGAAWLLGDARPAYADTLGGTDPFLAAMHVHGSWSEGPGSWQAQADRARQLGLRILFPTDHGYRALAYGYWTSMQGPSFKQSTTGSFAQEAATDDSGTLRLLAESANTTSAASLNMYIDDTDNKAIREKLRTSIQGTTLSPAFSDSSYLSNGAKFQIVVTLSYHTATNGRPAGTYTLVYRFGAGQAPGTAYENNGLTGVVLKPFQTGSNSPVLNLPKDVQALWPDLIAADNAFYELSFVAISPSKGAVVDVQFSCSIARAGHTPKGVAAVQSQIATRYSTNGLTLYPSIEAGHATTHLNLFTDPQYIPGEALDHASTLDQYCQDVVDQTHSVGGLASFNHPFGYNTGPLLSPTEQASKRRQVFSDMLAKDLYSVDILEVGYAVRGQVNMDTHLALWDTFSRRGIFVTGNGVNDDHSGLSWRYLSNGFATGIWANSAGHADLISALASGRAFTYHPGHYPGGRLDLLVDAAVPMGKASVSSKTSRSLEIEADNLPSTSTVEVVQGLIDYTGSDPANTVTSIPRSAFGTSGVAKVSLDTSRSTYVRVVVRDSNGKPVGASNPTYLFRSAPPGGIPAPRAVA